MKMVFWILLALFLTLVFFLVRGKKRKKKLSIPLTILSLVMVLPILALSFVWVSFHLSPDYVRPTSSEVLLESDGIKIGTASKKQPKTLDEYIKMTSEQIRVFNKIEKNVWNQSDFEGATIYFVTNDKKKAWSMDNTGDYSLMENPSDVPNYNSILGYETEFFPLREDTDGIKGMVIVVSEDELLDEKRYEKYTHIGNYDPIITYIHEGFHLFVQDNSQWQHDTSGVKNVDLTNTKARVLRADIIRLIFEAIDNEEERELLTKQAVKLYQLYKENYPDDYQQNIYHDRIEGSAYYFEVLTCLQSCYADEINDTNLVNAVGLWTNTDQQFALTYESYSLGLSGVLLDYYDGDNQNWKQELMKKNMTQMDILEGKFSQDELDAIDVSLPSAEFTKQIEIDIKAIEGEPNYALIKFFYDIFF